MSRIVLRFDLLPGLAESLVEPLRNVLKKLGDDLPRKPQEPEDPDLAAIWAAELKKRFREDANVLLEALEDAEFGQSGYAIEETRAESLVRGCSALRLALRETALGDVSDTELEEGEVHPVHVSEEHREGVLCFWFLGALQELLVQSLEGEGDNPSAAE